jgi:hypothetical protein
MPDDTRKDVLATSKMHLALDMRRMDLRMPEPP